MAPLILTATHILDRTPQWRRNGAVWWRVAGVVVPAVSELSVASQAVGITEFRIAHAMSRLAIAVAPAGTLLRFPGPGLTPQVGIENAGLVGEF